MRYLAILAVLLCVATVQAAPPTSPTARKRAVLSATEEYNRQARVKAYRENAPVIGGWELETTPDGWTKRVPKAWTNPSYKKPEKPKDAVTLP